MIRKKQGIHTAIEGYFREANATDIMIVADKLREEDCNTIKWMTDLPNREAMKITCKASLESYTIVVDGRPVGMFGVAGKKDIVQPWLLMSDWMSEFPHLKREFLVECRRVILGFKPKYKKLFNFVYRDHKDHIKWLEWLGFKVKDLYTEFGPYKKPFYYFEMENK